MPNGTDPHTLAPGAMPTDVLPAITIVRLSQGNYKLETDGIDLYTVPSVLRMMAAKVENKLVETG